MPLDRLKQQVLLYAHQKGCAITKSWCGVDPTGKMVLMNQRHSEKHVFFFRPRKTEAAEVSGSN